MGKSIEVAAADARATRLGRDEGAIPGGPYCYVPEGVGRTEGGLPRLKARTCPYWAMDPGRPAQENGYCAYLRSGDWESDGMSLLWDQVKECGVDQDHEGDFL